MENGSASPAEEQEQARKVARAACLNCRRAKRKCDGVQPVCGSCVARQVATPCEFVASKRGGPRYKGKKVVPADPNQPIQPKPAPSAASSSTKRKRPNGAAAQPTPSAKKKTGASAASPLSATPKVPSQAQSHVRSGSSGRASLSSDRSGTSSGASHSAVTPAMASPMLPISVMTPVLPTMSQSLDPRIDWPKNMNAPPYINSHSFAQSHQRGMAAPASSQASNASPRDTLDGSPVTDPAGGLWNQAHQQHQAQQHQQQQQAHSSYGTVNMHQPSQQQQQQQQQQQAGSHVYNWQGQGQPSHLPTVMQPRPGARDDGHALSSTNLEIFHRMQPQLAPNQPLLTSTTTANPMFMGRNNDPSQPYEQHHHDPELPPMIADFFSRIETLPKAGPGGDASRAEEPMSFDMDTQDYLTDLLGTSIFDNKGGTDQSNSEGASQNTKINRPGAAVDSESQARLVLSAYYKHVYPACPILLPISNLTALSTYFSDKDGPCALFAAISACVSLHLSSADAWMTLRGGSRLRRTSKSGPTVESDEACEPDGDEEMNKADVTQHDIANHHARTSQWLLQRFAEQQAAAKGLRCASVTETRKPAPAQEPPAYQHNSCGLKPGPVSGSGPLPDKVQQPQYLTVNAPRTPIGIAAASSASPTEGSSTGPDTMGHGTGGKSDTLPPRPFCSVTPDMDLLNMEATAARVLLAHFYYGKSDPADHVQAHRIAVAALDGCGALKVHEEQHVRALEELEGENRKAYAFSPYLRTEWARRLLWCSYSAATVITATGGFAPLPRTSTKDEKEDLELRPSQDADDSGWIVLIRGSQFVSRIYRILYELEQLRQNARNLKRNELEASARSSPKSGGDGGTASLARYSSTSNGTASAASATASLAHASLETLALMRKYTAQRDRLYDDSTRVDQEILLFTRYDLAWRDGPQTGRMKRGSPHGDAMSPTLVTSDLHSEAELGRSLRVAGKCMTTGATIILHRARAYADARILMQPHCGMPGIQLEEPEFGAEDANGAENEVSVARVAGSGPGTPKEALPSMDELMTDLKGASTSDAAHAGSLVIHTPGGSGSSASGSGSGTASLPPPSTLVLPDYDVLSASFGPFAPSYSFNRCRDAADSMYRALVPILRSDDGLSAPQLPPYSACSCLLAAYVLLMQTLAVQVGSYGVATSGGAAATEHKITGGASSSSMALTHGSNGNAQANVATATLYDKLAANADADPYALVDHFRNSVRHLESVLDRFARVWAKARSYKEEVAVLLAANESLVV